MGVVARVDPLLQALQRGSGAPDSSVAPLTSAIAPPRVVKDGEILLGHASNRDQVGLGLAKLIEGRLLIQGNSGAGKSMLLRRLFEQAFGKVQQLLLDRDGEFSTLAEKFDVAVLNAADVIRIGGRAFALHIRQHRYSAVLDLSDATSEDCVATVGELVTGLVEAPAEFWQPMLVLIDEAQTLVPRYDPGDVDQATRKQTIRALADLMSRGRKRGLAGVIATSRIAETSTPVISKPTNIIVGRTVFDRDLERAGNALGFTVGHSRQLRSLADGEFLGIGPALGAARVRFKAAGVESRHKGKTPDVAAPPTISAAAAAELLRAVPGAVAAEQTFSLPEKADTRGSGRYWSDEEDRIVKQGYANTTKLNDIARQLAEAGYRRRTIGSISMRASALGCRSNSPIAKGGWTPAEDEIMIAAYADKDVKIMDIVGMLAASGFDRGRVSVQMRAIALGITRDRVNYYTDEETAIAKAGLEAGKSNREVIQDLAAAGYHRGVTSISKFAQKHGYDRRAEAWTAEDIEKLKELYVPGCSTKAVAEAMGRPVSAVAAYASKLNLKSRTGWSDDDFQRLETAWHDGKSLAETSTLLGRPYPNVAATAKRVGLNFHITPKERGKAVPQTKKEGARMSQKHAPSMHHRKRKGKTRMWVRHPEDWYIEEEWVNDRLFAVEPFVGRVHDPACGSGRIVRAARRAGLRATGSDIVRRAPGFRVGNFFEQTKTVDNIVCNLPFRFAMAFIGHALNLAQHKVAMIVPRAWVGGDERSRWLDRTPLRRVWHLSPRPSMPPGPVVMAGKQKIGNGTTDYSWAVWDHGYVGRPELCFLRRDDGPSSITSVLAPESTAQLLQKDLV